MKFTCDTSVLIPTIASWHTAHEHCVEVVTTRDVSAIPAHVLLETYSVLTRLPRESRVGAEIVSAALDALPWRAIGLPAEEHLVLIRRLSADGLSGGAVYDGLVASTAAHHGLTLLTRDTRARRVYDMLGCVYEMV